MRPVPLSLLLLLSFLSSPLNSTVVDTLLSFNGIAREELATTTSNLVIVKEEQNPVAIATEEVPDALDTQVVSSSPFVKVKVDNVVLR